MACDLSCRGHIDPQGDSTENNYFVDNCSAKISYCEPESAYPDPPVGGALPEPNVDMLQTTETSTRTSTFSLTRTSTLRLR